MGICPVCRRKNHLPLKYSIFHYAIPVLSFGESLLMTKMGHESGVSS